MHDLLGQVLDDAIVTETKLVGWCLLQKQVEDVCASKECLLSTNLQQAKQYCSQCVQVGECARRSNRYHACKAFDGLGLQLPTAACQ